MKEETYCLLIKTFKTISEPPHKEKKRRTSERTNMATLYKSHEDKNIRILPKKREERIKTRGTALIMQALPCEICSRDKGERRRGWSLTDVPQLYNQGC